MSFRVILFSNKIDHFNFFRNDIRSFASAAYKPYEYTGNCEVKAYSLNNDSHTCQIDPDSSDTFFEVNEFALGLITEIDH